MKKKSSLLHRFLLLLHPIVVVMVFLLTYSVNVNAASVNDGQSYPFNISNRYVIDDKTINGIYYDFLLPYQSEIIETINTNLTNYSISYDSYVVTISDFSNHTTNLHGAQPYCKCWFNVYVNPTINYGLSQDSSFTEGNVTVSYDSYYRYVIFWRPASGWGFVNQNHLIQGSGSVNLLGSVAFSSFTPFNTSSDTFGSGYFNPNYPVILYNTDVINASNGSEIIIDRVPASLPPLGLAVPPITPILPDFDSLTVPDKVPPTYVINNYSWTTKPTFDNTDTLSALGSIKDYIVWLGDNLLGEFSNLGSNLVGLFQYLGQTIQYFASIINENLSNLINNLYDNFKALIEPIADNINRVAIVFASIIALGTDPETGVFSIPYLTNVLFVPDFVEVYQIILNHDELGFFPFVSAVGMKGKSIINTLTSVTPSHTFHVPSCYYHGIEIGNFDLDFSWFDNYKIYWDIIMNGFLITGYIIWLFVTASSHLRGHMIDGKEPQTDTFSFPSGWDGDY